VPTELQDRRSKVFGTSPIALALFLLLCPRLNGQAQLPVAKLFTIFPCGGKAGSSVEVEVTGQDLDDLRGLYFSNTNISAKQIKGPKFAITIPTTAPVGVYDVRAVGRFGISNPRPFVIGGLPEQIATSTNTAPESAMAVTNNTTLNGRTSSEAVQYFRFAAPKGQRVLVECDAADLDSRLSPSLTLLDAAGREVASAKAGELLDVQPSADSEFLVRLHDFLYRGGAEYFYRLTISTRPHIDYVLPPTALAASKTKLKLFGRNLPGGKLAEAAKLQGKPLEELEVEVTAPPKSSVADRSSGALLKPASALVDGFEYRLSTAEGPSNPVFISFAGAPVVLEQEPNDKPEQAQLVSLPCELSGQFYPEHDRDWAKFEAKKGDVIWIEALSQRLGLPTSPFMVVQRVTKDENGKERFEDVREFYDPENHPEFKTGNLDPASRLEIKEAGEYRLEIRDLFNSYSDPGRVYRLSLRKESPDFTLVALSQPAGPPKKDSKEAAVVVPFLRRGETIPIKIAALRREGFKGSIELSTRGLPESISVSHGRIDTGSNSTLLFLTASETGPGWHGSFEIVGRASVDSEELVRRARGATTIWNTGDVSVEPAQPRIMRDLAIAASDDEPAPIVLKPLKEKVRETCVAATLKLDYRIARHGDFTSALKLKPIGVPGVDAKEIDIDAKATNAAVQLDLAKAQPGEYELVLQTQVQGKYKSPAEGTNAKPRDVTIAVYSKPLSLKIAAVPIVMSEKTSTNSVHPGEKLQLPVSVKRLYGFEDAVDLALSGPKSIKELKPAKASISKEEQEKTIELAIPAEAAPGTYDFSLEAELKFNKKTLKTDRKIPVRILAAEAASK